MDQTDLNNPVSPINRATTILRFALCPLLLASRRGQAMAEILVAIPVLILIFAAVLFFGEGYYRKADTILAARYAVWTDSRAGKSQVSETDLARLFFDSEEAQELLKLKDAPETESFANDLLFGLSDLLGHGSGTEGKTLSFTFRPRPGSDKNTIMSSTHYLDGNTWDGGHEPGNTLRFVSWGIAAARSGSSPVVSQNGQYSGNVGGQDVKKPF